MPTLYRKKSPTGKILPCWYCAFRVPTSEGGTRQVHRSTGYTKKGDAMDEARKYEKAAKLEAASDDETSSAILAKVTEAGELALKGRLNPAHGRRLIGEIMMLSGDNAGGNFSLREWVADWFKEKAETVKPSTAQLYRATTAQFIDFVGDKADDPLDAVTTKQVRDYRDSIRKGRTAKTANHKLKVLRSLFGDAVKVSALLHNPAAPIKSLEESDSVPREPFTPAEVGNLITTSTSNDWKGVILLGAFTGLRLTDATRLTAGNLDMKRKVINLTPRKTERKGTTVEIPLHPDLVDFFNGHHIPPFGKSPLFPSLTSLESGGRGGLSDQFKEIMKAAKVDRGIARIKGEGVARTTAARSFHSLRHTFTSWLAKADVPEEVRMKMTGHTESKTHQKYTHHEMETLRDSVGKIPRINQPSA